MEFCVLSKKYHLTLGDDRPLLTKHGTVCTGRFGVTFVRGGEQ